jgi:diguanylate cyclase (GGDEF)-like protein
MLDIDHFKRINDSHGHQRGDDVLKAVAASIKGQLRNVDMVFRLAGKSF